MRIHRETSDDVEWGNSKHFSLVELHVLICNFESTMTFDYDSITYDSFISIGETTIHLITLETISAEAQRTIIEINTAR